MIHVCIIDDGLDVSKVGLGCIREQIVVGKVGVSSSMHGTTCAKIIKEICSEVEFTDIKILNSDLKASIVDLKKALEIAYYKVPDILHLSIGTINTYDEKYIMDSIIKFKNKGIPIVASYNNMNTYTFPAHHAYVFGIMELSNISSNSIFNYCKNDLGAVWGVKITSSNVLKCNSYAAAVFTGYFCKDYLNKIDSIKYLYEVANKVSFLPERENYCVDINFYYCIIKYDEWKKELFEVFSNVINRLYDLEVNVKFFEDINEFMFDKSLKFDFEKMSKLDFEKMFAFYNLDYGIILKNKESQLNDLENICKERFNKGYIVDLRENEMNIEYYSIGGVKKLSIQFDRSSLTEAIIGMLFTGR